MKQTCSKCSTETMCPQCNYDNFNQPIVIKHIDKEMPIIVSMCVICCVELFKSMTYENTTIHKNYCIACAGKLEDEAWKYRELNK